MPLCGPVSFLPVTDELLAHWTAVDTTLGASGPITLYGGMNRAALRDLRSRLVQAQREVAEIRRTRAAEKRDLQALSISIDRRLAQFNQKVTEWGKSASSPDEAAAVWLELERSGGAFNLPTRYGRLDFVTDLSARKLIENALTSAERMLMMVRGHRDSLQDQLHAFVALYREQVSDVLAKGHELLGTLPLLSLPRGHLPEAVDLHGMWDGKAALLRWEAANEYDLVRYDIRGMAGAEYEVEDEMPVASIAAGEPCELVTSFELEESAAVTSFRVYAVLASGHERGSQPVVVERG